MQNAQSHFSKLDIEDAVKLFADCGTLVSTGSKNEFLFIRSRAGLGNKQPHKSNYYSLAIVISGHCKQIINDHSVTLSSGSLLFTTPGDIKTSKKCSSNLEIRQQLFTKSFLQKARLPDDVLEELLWIDSDKPPVFQFEQEEFQKTEQLFEKIAAEASSSREYHKQILRNNIIELLYRINRLDKPCLKKGNETSSQKNRLFEEFSDLVSKQFKEKKKVHDYAQQLHVTPKHLSEVVKQESGHTALEYIHRRILHEAKNLLTHTNRSAKEIAYDLGFNTPSQFGRFFKRKTDKSPIQFRNSRKTEH